MVERLQLKSEKITHLLQNLEATKAFGESSSTSTATTPSSEYQNRIPSFGELQKNKNIKKRKEEE